MPLTSEDLAQLSDFIDSRITATAVAHAPTAEQAEQSRAAVVGIPDVPADAGPEFWIHLANGDTIVSHDSGSTHVDVDGEPVAVIGRYQKGA
jgi:hypothetical protein